MNTKGSRRRIQRQTTGGRGRKSDPLYRARRALRTGACLSIDPQAQRLEELFTHERHAAVQATWGIDQRPIQAYRHQDRGLGRFLMQRAIDSLARPIPAGLEEITALAKTLTSRSQGILAHFERPHTPNGPIQAVGGRLEHLRASSWDSGTCPTTPPATSSTPNTSRTNSKQPPKPTDKPHLPRPQTQKRPFTRDAA
ncbi:transposase [Actinomyces bowdenii]|uniref:transposase n=1 Tax=Actinomyces bowdenii TaxID=131109 RepID=UPI001FBB3B5B|nr:transposase [Actinomyces bowdenii]